MTITRFPKLMLKLILIAGLALALFAIACVGYYLVCRQLYLLCGTGFLAGLLPAWPAALWHARMAQERPHSTWMLLSFILSFSLCFWGAALMILWRMGS